MNISTLKSGRWVAAIAVAALLAVFAGGAFAGQAMAGDDEKPVTRLTLGTAPSASNGDGDDSDSALAAEESKRSAAGAASDMRYWPYCPASLPAGVVGETIDPAAAGIAVRFLGPGFELQSVTVRAEGECDEAGAVTNVVPVIDSSWVHTATGATMWVSQRESGEVANYIDQWSALVWSDGYAFQLSAGGGYPMPLAADKPVADDAATSYLPSPIANEDVTAALNEAIAQLAPSVSAECFYRVVDGTWDDLASFGLGDPSSALPAGYTESHASIRTLHEPAASCDSPELEGAYAPSVDASFSETAGGWIGISAYRVVQADVYPGGSSAGSVYWTDGEWQFSIYGYSSDGTPLALETLTAIARALSPDFDEQCLATDTPLTADAVAAAGFNTPVVPAGYELQKSDFVLNAIPADCEVDADVTGTGYRLYWSYAGASGSSIEVSVTRPGAVVEPASGGYINEFGAGWTSADGTNFNISAFRGETSPLTIEEITAIALSLDPDLDPAVLEDSPEILPARDGAAAPDAS